MPRFDEATLQEIRARADIVQVISSYVALKRQGKGYVGLCPFHEERTPSFHVSPDKQVFHCFGCQASGDVFSFLMKRDGLAFADAVEELARRTGVALAQASDDPAALRRENRRRLVLEALAMAARYYQAVLHHAHGSQAREYLQRRGLAQAAWERFGLGFAPASGQALLRALTSKGIASDVLVEAGLVSARASGRGHYDRFRGRIMFPIWDERGRVVGFGGRVLGEGQPKYLNSPDGPLFRKRQLLYGLHLAKEAMQQHERAIVVEGYMDCIAAQEAGFAETVASMGTALSDEQATRLGRHVQRVVIAYDADAAGQAATLRGLEILQQHVAEVRVLRLPVGKDPDELVRQKGVQAFEQALQEAEPLLAYRFRRALAEHDPRTPEGKGQIARAVAGALAAERNEVTANEWLRRFAGELGIDEAGFRKMVARARGLEKAGDPHKNRHTWHNSRSLPVKGENLSESGPNSGGLQAQEHLLRILVQRPELLPPLAPRLKGSLFTGPYRTLVEAMLEGTRPGHSLLDQLLGRIFEPGLRDLLIRLATEEVWYEDYGKAAEGNLVSLERFALGRRAAELRESIKAREAQGDEVPAAWLQEYQDLTRRLKVAQA